MIRRFFQPPARDRWEDYFEPGEVLLWQGAPVPGPQSYLGPAALSLFGLPFLIVGVGSFGTGLGHLFGMNSASDFGLGLFVLAFSLPFLAMGTALTAGTWLYAMHAHKHIRYALTNKRAYVAKSLFRYSLDTYTIGADDVISLELGTRCSVRFKTVHGTDSEGEKTTDRIGFESIADGHAVYALIRQIQREQT